MHVTTTKWWALIISLVLKTTTHLCLNRDLNPETCAAQFRSTSLNMIWFWSQTTTPTDIHSGTTSEFPTRSPAEPTVLTLSTCSSLIHSTIMVCALWCTAKSTPKSTGKAGLGQVATSAITRTQWSAKAWDTTTRLHFECNSTMTTILFTSHIAILTLTQTWQDTSIH